MTSSTLPHIAVRIDQRNADTRVAYLTIGNEPKLNTLNSVLMQEFLGAVQELARDESLRAVVLTGAGTRAFIGGADIHEMSQLDAISGRAFITLLHRCCDALRELPVPVIARINGYALGAGLEIAAACDLRIAADTARFGMPEVKLGIPSVIEAALLPSLIGWGRTRHLLLLGETITSAEALQWGLIEMVVPLSKFYSSAALDEAVEVWVSSILKAGPRAIRLQKKLIRSWEDLPLSDAVRAGVDAFAAAWETDEPRRMMREFLADRARRIDDANKSSRGAVPPE
jgi:enoyl-CoA hydratase/carnithine racemase